MTDAQVRYYIRRIGADGIREIIRLVQMHKYTTRQIANRVVKFLEKQGTHERREGAR
jgi:hypothetical protein